MSQIDQYLAELASQLHVRGRARARLLAECRDHLIDSSEVHGEAVAIRHFGSAAELARSFETEVAVRRGLHATIASIVGVAAVAISALTVVNASTSQASAVPVWAVTFFAAAQASAVCIVLAALRAAAMRHESATPADVALLSRRNLAALAFALLTLLAAAGAITGQAAAWRILLGPIVALVAAVMVLRTRSLTRKLNLTKQKPVREPVADLYAALPEGMRRSIPQVSVRPIALLGLMIAIAAVAAFFWDHLDHGTTTSSFVTASIEVTMVATGFLLLGPGLGLWATRRNRTAAQH